jgi:phosphoribosylformimino-5-aminoimidazole carboxamide ribotide isomerase
MLIIPAVDIKDGKCVRLRQGRAEEETVYSTDPAAMACRWQAEGAQYLHVVDLDGAFEGRRVNADLIRAILRRVHIPVEVGGGIRTYKDVEEYLEAGADRVIIGTRAVESPFWLRVLCDKFPNRVAVGVDAREGRVAVKGWKLVTEMAASELVENLEGYGLAALIYTDVAKDGMLVGPNFEAIAALHKQTKIPLVASGGISRVAHVKRLAQMGVYAAIIGRALYTGDISLPAAVVAGK